MKLLQKYSSYVKNNPQKLWFKAKWYGWGWTPVSWEGWLITGVYIGLIFLLGSSIDENSPRNETFFMFVLPTTLLTIIFIRIAYKKGEKPGWHWGPPESK